MIFNNINVRISPNALIGSNVRIGDNTIIYDNVEIDDNTTIGSNCLIGEPLNDYYYNQNYQNPRLYIGKNSLIRSKTTIYAGSLINDFFQTGHNVVIRENMMIGHHCSVGSFSDLQGFSKLGNYCRLHSNVHIGQRTSLGNYVFVYPFVVFTNDPHPPSTICKGSTVGDYSQIAVHSVILPDSSIGKNCLVGANSTVRGHYEEFSLIIGSPSKRVGSVDMVKSQLPNSLGESYYPWMNNFERGMPWEGIGFNNWFEDL